jgi:hypothetical protein
VSNPKYTGNVMLYPEPFLKKYFETKEETKTEPFLKNYFETKEETEYDAPF